MARFYTYQTFYYKFFLFINKIELDKSTLKALIYVINTFIFIFYIFYIFYSIFIPIPNLINI